MDSRGDRADITAISSNVASDDHDARQRLSARCLLGELLDLGVGLKEADDAVGLALVFVQGVDGVEEDHDARGDPYWIRMRFPQA